jgi:hypothetical protein
MNKVTKAESARRVKSVYKLLLKGVNGGYSANLDESRHFLALSSLNFDVHNSANAAKSCHKSRSIMSDSRLLSHFQRHWQHLLALCSNGSWSVADQMRFVGA